MKLSSGKRIGQSGHELYLAAIFSFTLHAIAFSAAVLLYTAGPTRISVPAYYNVKLVGLPSEAQQAASSPSQPLSEPAPVLPPSPAQHAPQTKQAPARELSAPAKPNPGAMPELANTKLKQKQEKAEPERPVEKPAVQSPGPTSAGKAGTTGQVAKAEGVAVAAPEGFKPEFQPYVDRVRERISLNWNPPPGSADTAVKVQFTVLRSGRVGDVKLIASSGNFYFDQAAYRAILSSSPFPPLPEGFYRDFELFSVDLMEKEK
ncbi:MAG TPA: TonB family protein [Nitrospirota bacterium]|nr:TonB family protein [Nitrospirota bacterium]